MAVLLFASCRSLKPVIASGPAENPKKDNSSPVFIDNITAKTPGQRGIIAAPSSKVSVNNKVEQVESTETELTETEMEPIRKANINEKAAIENSGKLQFKYSIMLNVAVEELTNYRLLEFIEEWYGTRYVYGGSTKRGIDCSAFSGTLQATVFGRGLPRIAQDQFLYSERISRTRLQEGDLVFFNTTGGISHVGIYLKNNKFIHASSSHGVTISDLNDTYYSKRFIAAGRVRENDKTKIAASNY